MSIRKYSFLIVVITLLFHKSHCTTCVKDIDSSKLIETSNGQIPHGAVYGGFDRGRSMFLCLAKAQSGNGELIGKLAETQQVCFYGEEDKEFSTPDYKAVTNVDGVWVPVIPPEVPCNMIQFATFLEKQVYAGRINIDNTLTMGSVIGSTAYIPYGGRNQIKKNEYEVFSAVSKKLDVNGNSNRFATTGKYLTFKVKSGDEVAIYLGLRKVNHFVITIGAKGTIAVGTVYYPFYTNTRAASDLNENVGKGFWVRWTTRDYLEFGREGDIIPILTLKDENVFKIDSVVFSSPNGASEWLLPELII